MPFVIEMHFIGFCVFYNIVQTIEFEMVHTSIQSKLNRTPFVVADLCLMSNILF